MGLSGSFEGMPPQDLIQWIERGKKNGILSARCNNSAFTIHFNNGNVVGVHSSRSKDRLGAILLRENIIDRNQLERLRQDQTGKDCFLGKMLLEKKIITADHLSKALIDQVHEIIVNILMQEKGSFEFDERALTDTEKVIDEVKSQNLLMECSRRVDELCRIREEIPEKDFIVRMTGVDPDKKIEGIEKDIIDQLKEAKLVRDIIESVNASEFSILETIKKSIDSGIIDRDKKAETQKENMDTLIRNDLKRVRYLIKDKGFHEALTLLAKILEMDSLCKEAQKLTLDIKVYIVRDAKRMIQSPRVTPKIRQSFASSSPEKFQLSSEEGFVFSRIDGKTNFKSLQYLINIKGDDLYLVLHKLVRMGLIYFDNKASEHRTGK